MSELTSKLAAIAEKRKQLEAQEAKLIEKRKNEISNFAEQFNLLGVSNEFIIGLFSEAEKAIKSNSEKFTNWENEGRKVLKNSKSIRYAKKAEEAAA